MQRCQWDPIIMQSRDHMQSRIIMQNRIIMQSRGSSSVGYAIAAGTFT